MVAELSTQQFWHLTDNPDFSLDPTKVPEDNALAIRQRSAPGLYVGDPEHWINGSGYVRPYVAEIQAPAEAAHDERWGGEKFIPAENFGQAKVARVIPTDAYAREHYGSTGWIEDRLGTTFDTDEPIDSSSPQSWDDIYPYRGYHYGGPDVREMSAEERQRHAERTRTALENW